MKINIRFYRKCYNLIKVLTYKSLIVRKLVKKNHKIGLWLAGLRLKNHKIVISLPDPV